MNSAQVWRAASFLLLICSFRTYGQNSDHKPVTIITFDPPGSTSTVPSAITAAGAVVGSYSDSSGAQHGFLRNADGSFTTFDPPGSTLTTPTAINPAGTVAGAYNDAAGVTHGFMRTARGAFTSFDAPSGVILNSIYLFDGPPPSINPSRAIAGTYSVFVPSFTEHGFLRERNGTLTTIDFPGSTFTEVLAINPAGTLIGDFGNNFQGFLRTPDGTFITTDFPGFPVCINPAGTTAGTYTDASNVTHGFVRSPNGTITTFEAPGSAFMVVFAINPAGTLTGYYFTDTFHGFLRAPHGAFTTFDVPGSTGTAGFAINPAGTVTGVFFDAAGGMHGFLFFTIL
jgi:predicted membrane protein